MIKELLKKNKRLNTLIVKAGKKRRIKQIQKLGIEELEKVTNTLNNSGICAFADFGTLLGLMREGGPLKHDADMDVGIILQNDNTVKEADFCLKSLGYKRFRQFSINDSIKERSYIKNHVKMDLQFYTVEEETGLMFCYLFYNKPIDIKKKYWKSVIKKCPLVEDIKTINIKNHLIYVPKNAEDILRYKYGDSWRIPDKSWVYWEGPNTFTVNDIGVFQSIENRDVMSD